MLFLGFVFSPSTSLLVCDALANQYSYALLCALLQDFSPGAMRGYWKLSYADDEFRVFYTNKGNLFVLRKIA
jgi:hypothetical protein